MRNENRNLRNVLLVLMLVCWILVLYASLLEQRINHNAEIFVLKSELQQKEVDLAESRTYIHVLEKDLETYKGSIHSLNMQRGRILAELERARQAE